jgi:polar amino acid transport system permease protein
VTAPSHWDWAYAWEILPDLLAGLWMTVLVTTAAGAVSATLGLGWALVGQTARRPVRWVLAGALDFVRGTPLIVQIFFVFFVFAKHGFVLSAFMAGVVVYGLHFSAYMAGVYRANIQAVPRGQWEAAKALGLSRRRTWSVIVLPVAMRRSVPALASYLIQMYKDTALLFAIGLPVLLYEARDVGTQSFRFLEPYTMAGLLYLMISIPAARLLRRLETQHG